MTGTHPRTLRRSEGKVVMIVDADVRIGGLEVRAVVASVIAYPGMAEIVTRVKQTLSRRVPAIAATFGRP